MLRLRDGQTELFDAVLPPEARVLSHELALIDAVLDDERFLAPFVARFSCPIGRPTIPIETYLRLMYLKHRYSLGLRHACQGGSGLAVVAALQPAGVDRGSATLDHVAQAHTAVWP